MGWGEALLQSTFILKKNCLGAEWLGNVNTDGERGRQHNHEGQAMKGSQVPKEMSTQLYAKAQVRTSAQPWGAEDLTSTHPWRGMGQDERGGPGVSTVMAGQGT